MSGKYIVLKVGGEVIRSSALALVAREVVALLRGGHRLVVVHGGGPQATSLQMQLGQEPKLVGGRRVTDGATLEVMKMAVAGQANVDLCAALLAEGARPVGLHGASSGAIGAVKRPPRVVSGGGDAPIDFGFVGDVTGVNGDLVDLLVGGGYLPVLACLGADASGQVFNINADVVAHQASVALRADALILLTDVAGVLRDRGDPTTRIARLTVSEARRAIAEGIIAGGMIPKIEESFQAIVAGVRAVCIIGSLQTGDLVRAVTEPGSSGTWLLPDAP